uniref:(northern house mosquito) hypothetical protein n=1 Tax=Culex pipiens TaxID=7175 RepID=A0A8D8CEN6_CULPI
MLTAKFQFYNFCLRQSTVPMVCGPSRVVSLALSGGNSTRRRRVWGTHGDSEVGPGVNYEWEQNNATRRGVEWLAVLRQPPLLERAVRRGGPRRRYNKTSGIKSHTQRGIQRQVSSR